MNSNLIYSISGSRSTATVRSHSLFDITYQEPNKSVIDIYEGNMLSYKKLIGCFIYETQSQSHIALAENQGDEWVKLSNLLILGFISSVENYVRGLIRRLLLIDEDSRKCSYKREITYGAAIHHDKKLMPEALMEGCSFHSSTNIKNTIKSMTGINLDSGKKDHPELSSAFIDYDFVGELRHCVVHRSGLFGSNNALSLGLDEYQNFLEKPLKLEVPAIQAAANACDTLVKELNDVMFSKILIRTCKTYDWKGDLRQDKKTFDKYFYLFSPESNYQNRKDCYNNFREKCNLRYINRS